MAVSATITATIMPSIDDDGTPDASGAFIVHLYRFVKAGVCGPWGQYPLPIERGTLTDEAENVLRAAGYILAGPWVPRTSGCGLVVEAEVIRA